MCIIRHSFIGKTEIQTTLHELVENNYLNLQKYNNYTIYNPNKPIIYNYIQQFKNVQTVEEIISIQKELYMTTAVFSNVILFIYLETSTMVLKFK